MKVILKQDVKGTGKKGDVVKVSDGFARNRLIPKGLAVEATKNNINAYNKKKAADEAKYAEEKAEAEELKKELEGKAVKVVTKTGGGKKLFGSITSMNIAEAIKEQTGKEVDKKKIVLDKPIKEIGSTEIEIKLFTGVTANVKVNVVGEE